MNRERDRDEKITGQMVSVLYSSCRLDELIYRICVVMKGF